MGTGRKKTEMKKIEKESRRMVTFSKRRKGLFKKAHEFQALTGCRIALIVFSPAGKPFIYGQPSSDPVIDRYLNPTVHASENCKTVLDDQYVNSGSPSSGNSDSPPSNNNGSELEESFMLSDLETLMLGIENDDDVEGCGELEELMGLKKYLEEKREKVGERIAAMENEFLDCLLQL